MSHGSYHTVPAERATEDEKTTNHWPKTNVVILITLTVCIFFVGGIALGYYIRHLNFENFETAPEESNDVESTWSPINLNARHKKILDGDSTYFMALYEELKKAAATSNSTYIVDNVEVVNKISQYFGSHMDQSERQECEWHTTRPHPELANIVRLKDKNDTVLLNWQSKIQNISVLNNAPGNEENLKVDFQPYVAGSAAGKVKGDVVFLNYGLEADFAIVRQSKIPLEGRIALVRTRGDQSLAHKVDLAQSYNMTAMLVYLDPDDVPLMPVCGDSVPVVSLHSLRERVMENPSILVQTIPCVVARTLLERLTGRTAPKSWQNNNYIKHMGRISSKPGSWFAEVEVNNVDVVNMTQTSLIGTIHGRDDPEHYIIMGVNRLALTPGEQTERLRDTTMLLEIARQLKKLVKETIWLPKRTIKLCSWAGHEGMAKYFEDNYEVLANKMVAYISLDQLRFGHDTLDGEGSVGLINALRSAADMVPDPEHAGETVYDNWFYNTGESPVVGEADDTVLQEPYSTIQNYFYSKGIPYLQLKYVSLADFATTESVIPPIEQELSLNGTMFSQKEVESINTLTKVAGLTMLKLADWRLVDFDLVAMAKHLKQDTLEVTYRFSLVLPNDLVAALETASSDVVASTNAFEYYLDNVFDPANQIALRRINEKILQFGNTFLKVKNILTAIRKLEEEESSDQVTEAASRILHYMKSLPKVLLLHGI